MLHSRFAYCHSEEQGEEQRRGNREQKTQYSTQYSRESQFYFGIIVLGGFLLVILMARRRFGTSSFTR